MVNSSSILLTVAALFSTTFANIVDLNNFNLSPFVLTKKQDFTYSSGAADDDLSAIRFDLALLPLNTQSDLDYALMIITADQDASDALVNLMRNGTALALDTENGTKRKQIDFLNDVEQILQPIHETFAVYESVTFKGDKKVPTIYNQTFGIPTDGVFSTYFMFGRHKPQGEADEDFFDDMENFVDDVFGDDDPDRTNKDVHNRGLAPSELQKQQTKNTTITQTSTKVQLQINGQISFVNSFGFLNADQYPLMQFFLIMFVVYLVASCYWVHLMRKHTDNKVSIHYYFSSLLFITCVECACTFLEYDMYNSSGKRTLPMTVLSIFLMALRETLSHLVCLLVSLGYGIVMNVLNRYATKIGLLSFLFFIACAINQASFYISQHKPLSRSVKVMMVLPQIILEVVFLIWIISALKRTLTYLKIKKQEFKLGVMKKFALIFTIGVSIYIIIRTAKVMVEAFNADSDSWQNEHKFQISWFLTFTGTLFGSAWVFRPQDGSKMLAEVDELLDETLTEIGTIEGEGAANRLDSVEYAEQFDRRMKEREQQISTGQNFQFQAVSQDGQNDMFKHLDQIGQKSQNEEDKQIEFAIEEEANEDEEKQLD